MAPPRVRRCPETISVFRIVPTWSRAVLRRRWLAKAMSAKRFAAALSELASVPAAVTPVLPFMPRAYELRANVSPYDATYVALATRIRAPVLNCVPTLVVGGTCDCDPADCVSSY
jgi:hypothetical protein